MAVSRYYSGPSKTVDMVKSLSRTISRSNTLESADGEKGLRSLYIPGLGRKMVRSRQPSGAVTPIPIATPAARNRSPSPEAQAEAGMTL